MIREAVQTWLEAGARAARVRAPIAIAVAVLACGSKPAKSQDRARTDESSPAAAPAAQESAGSRNAAGEVLFRHAAETAWKLIERSYQPETGLVNATPEYPYATTWDIGSTLAALYSARELGLLEGAEYDRRMRRLLATLREAPLYDGMAYHKNYATETGVMVDRKGRPSQRGYGWSATDLGRFLVWLKIVAEKDPEYAEEIGRIVERMDYSKLLRNGYMLGRFLGGNPFQEGRVGYEQYAAAGFALWGHPPVKALDAMRNVEMREVLGHQVPTDRRGLDRLLSEPFVMMGLELGWTPEIRKMAEAVLAVQRARWEKTGQVTIVSEDAVSVPPFYFYYYCILCNGKEFVVDVAEPGQNLDEPRWVSTKNSFGWHALLPSDYTWLAVGTVQGARHEHGWASGVFEGSGESTKTLDVNTAAVILEAALYHKKGGPILDRAAVLGKDEE